VGFREEAVLRRRLPTHDGSDRRDQVVFSLFAGELEGAPAEVEAYDAAGDRLL
jgi:hypothetical protein